MSFEESAPFYDAIYAWKDYESEAARLHEVIQRYRPEARTLLDVACGTGMHVQHLREHYDVQGLDLNEKFLREARRRNPEVLFHRDDMVGFDLGTRFDVLTCLFSSIGYVKTLANLKLCVAAMRKHLAPGGVLIVEPWITSEAWEPGRLDALFVDEPDLKIARMAVSSAEGRISVVHFDYLVGTPKGISHFTEEHHLGLFSHEEYEAAFLEAGLTVEHDPEGLTGRGLYVARDP